jgi:isocitrate lyase
MFELADGYRDRGMAAFADVQQREFAAEERGFTATKHQRQVGAGYFDDVAEVISGGTVSTGALSGSTEERQF